LKADTGDSAAVTIPRVSLLDALRKLDPRVQWRNPVMFVGCLARQAGAIVMQRQLLREVWGPERMDDSRSLRVCIKNLRGKLEPDPRRPRYLVTETGLGYRLRADEEAAAEAPG